MAQKQGVMNRRLMKTLVGLRPHEDPDDFVVRVLRENSCLKGTLEFELALTMSLVQYIVKNFK
jgi:hypothetical protein